MTAHQKACISSALLLVVLGAIAVSAQNVPATAREAAKLPQYASRLAHAAATAQQRSPASSTTQRRAAMGGRADRSGLMSAFERSYLPPDFYSNGPINGTTDAWVINFGFVVADSFPSDAQVTGLSFGAWLFPGDVLQAVEVSITSQPFGGTTYFDGVVTLSQTNCSGNQFGFNVCTESGTFPGPLLGGTYWLNLQNAVVNSGDPVYWDENSGPSMAEENSVGTIPSESFTLQGGSGGPTCFQSQNHLQIIHDFTQQEGRGNGVALDAAGNLYGTTPAGGDHSAGFAYKLSRFANWLLDPLFSFFGGTSGGQPTGAIVGPNGSLYGGAQGGIQNCGSDGSQYCGLVYNLRPQPTTCANATCGWMEKVPYRFTSESDGWGTINVPAHDQQGNLYGTTTTGGAHGAGTVFELTPSGGGWTKTTLYSFTGGADGGQPTEVLVGNDGNLYGVAEDNYGVVFELTPSGGQWTETVLHTFAYDTNGYGPEHLVQDSAGNLYGAIIIPEIVLLGQSPAIFVLEKTGSGWAFSETGIAHCSEFGDRYGGSVNNLLIDAAGKLYGTGFDDGHNTAGGTNGSPVHGGFLCYDSYIFKAWYDTGGWHYHSLDLLSGTAFDSSGSLALDSSGNLYGTTTDCGANNAGTVWQFTP